MSKTYILMISIIIILGVSGTYSNIINTPIVDNVSKSKKDEVFQSSEFPNDYIKRYSIKNRNVISKSLFFVDFDRLTDTKSAGNKYKKKNKGLRLIGTILTLKKRIALISPSNTSSLIKVKVGTVLEGWTIKEIYSKEIVLIKNSKKMRLTLDNNS